MKINGKEIAKQGIEVVVFPRRDGDIVFKAKPVTDFTNFEKLCPLPKPQQIIKPGGVRIDDVESEDYKKQLDKWAEKRTAWMLMESLSATEGLTFDTVNPSDSETWTNFNKEMVDAGFSAVEIGKLFECISTACGLTQSKIEEATKRFLAGPDLQLVTP